MEVAKWQIPLDQMDVRWEVFRWPGKMAAEMAKQEKNLRQLEVSFKRQMEEEQEDFNQDVSNLKADVDKLKNLTALSDAVKNAETVRRLKTSLINADERSRLFNSRKQSNPIPNSMNSTPSRRDVVWFGPSNLALTVSFSSPNNPGETLFGVADTEYSDLAELAKLFDPFYDLWDRLIQSTLLLTLLS